LENNDKFIRYIIPKKKSLKDLNQDKLNLMFLHINSVQRKSLCGKTPYEAFEFFYGKETLDKLNIQKIAKDKVSLQPYLLK
jgi:IS30 family transposase